MRMRRLFISIIVLNLSLVLPGSALRSQTGEQDRRLTPDGELVDLSLRRSVVLIKISPVYYNQAMPWVREAGQSYTVMGLVMTGDRILMLGHDVRRAALLEVTKFSSYEPAIAEVDLLDMETNLALLKVRDPGFFDDLIPVPTGEDPELSSQASAIKVDQLFRVYREKVQVTELKTVADYGFTHLPVIIFRSDESFRYGGLLLCKTRVCGFIGYSDQEKRNESIPASVIATFRKRAAENDYSGFVAQGLVLESLVDPVRREYYHLPRERGGVLVARTLPGTSVYGTIQPEDVILSVDGTAIDNLGFYEDPKLGRQHINLLLARNGAELRRPGDQLSVVV
ncbi:MAG: hypothetical protein KDK34_08840, partial [Leptospiraceae bacterium]|nr:hypothetical protein [Leptospiraceae bacterium]